MIRQLLLLPNRGSFNPTDYDEGAETSRMRDQESFD
jgi:hypothetical protein